MTRSRPLKSIIFRSVSIYCALAGALTLVMILF